MSGAPLLLLHGVGLDHRMWGPCAAHLAGWDVRAPDLLGHGDAPAIRGRVSLRELAAAAVEGIAVPLHVVGFSLGGLVAQRLALDAPERVRSLTLVSSVARRDAREREAVRARLDAARRDMTAAIDASLRRWTGGDADRVPHVQLQAVRATLESIDHASFLAAYEAFAQGDAELWPRLGSIAAPTLAVTGSEDAGSTPAMTRLLADAIPGARAIVLPGVRHLLPLERPAQLAELITDHVRSTESHDDHVAEDLRASHRR